MTDAAPRPADLSDCDREPIHIPGSVQPHGALLAFGPDDRLAVVSANAAALLGIEVEPGAHIADLLGAETAQHLAHATSEPARVELGGRTFHRTTHRSAQLRIVELEPAPSESPQPGMSFANLRGVILRLSAAGSVQELCALAAAEIRTLTGYDRVMVYRFDPHWNGEVFAEAKREDLNPFLGLHYPATDIPEQARALYLANWIRVIADVAYEPVPLVPAVSPIDGAPVDLSHAVLRSVSPIHVEYLTNMGVAASMSISLVDQGRLWGLVACHHYAGAHHPPPAVRAEAEFLGQVVSLLLAAKERTDSYQRSITVQLLLARLGHRLSEEGADLVELLADQGEAVCQLVGAAGAALRLDGTWTTTGTSPDPGGLERIAGWLASRDHAEAVWSTDSLGRTAPQLADLAAVASGVLAAALTGGPGGDLMLWFRPEVIQTVDWGGDPKNKVIATAEDETVRLSPRKSFALWQETVRLTSPAWVPADHAAAEDFVRQLAGAALRQAQIAVEVARTLQRGLAPSEIPPVDGLAVAAQYRPGGHGEVGGDWYDLLDLPDDGVALVLGDVAGHGVSAATTMGHLRHAARAYLLEDHDPAVTLTRLNRLAQWVLPGEIATIVIAVFPKGGALVQLSSAGHLPPLLVQDGHSEFLDLVRAPAMGVKSDAAYVTTTLPLAADAMLVLYTDGLVERRGESIDVGLERLRAAATTHGPVEDLCDRLLATIPEGPDDDDLAVVTLRWTEAG